MHRQLGPFCDSSGLLALRLINPDMYCHAKSERIKAEIRGSSHKLLFAFRSFSGIRPECNSARFRTHYPDRIRVGPILVRVPPTTAAGTGIGHSGTCRHATGIGRPDRGQHPRHARKTQ